jgi:hypothetical protein
MRAISPGTVFETSRLFFVPICSVESVERINKPAVPERGDAIFRVQFFPVRAAHHERRIMENWEMGKKDSYDVQRQP